MERRDEEKFTEITNSITMNNLKKIIDEKGYSKEKVATSIGIAESTIYNYIARERTPYLNTLISLADFFNTSLDYLVDLTNNPLKVDDIEFINKDPELNQLMQNVMSLPKDKRELVIAYVKGLLNS